MLTKKQKKSRRTYFLILFIYTVALLVLGYLALRIVWRYAEEYETAQLEKVLDAYMEDINKTKWNDSIQTAADQLANSFQGPEDVEGVVREYLATGDITYSTGGIGDTMTYKLACNGQPIGSVSFEEDKTAESEFDMYPWKKSAESFDFLFLKNKDPYTVTIPQTYSVALNGKTVGEEFITEQGIQYDVLSQYYAEYPDLPTKVRYQVNDLVGSVKETIFDKNGNEYTIDPNVNDMQFVEPCTEAETAELKAFMEGGFVEAYIKFWGTKYVDTTYPTLLEYVKMGSPLQQEMQIYTLDAATWIHTNSVVVNDMKFNYALSLGGGCYVVSETVNSTAYADYKTVNETSEIVVIVMKDPETGEIKAINRA